MEGVLPISIGLNEASARRIGAHVRSGLVEVIRPPLVSMDKQLQAMGDVLKLVAVGVVDSLGNLQQARLRVQIMNDDLLEHIEATRWAVAYFSYNTFLELLNLLYRMHWLNGRSHIHLHDIIARLDSLNGAVAALTDTVAGIGDLVVALLEAILDQLRTGIGLTGQIQIVIAGGGGGSWLDNLDLWKLLGLLGILALALAAIVAFLFGVGSALALFSAKSLIAVLAIAGLVAALTPLMKTLAGFDWVDLAKIGVGFAGIAGFVAGLGLAFQKVTSDLEKIVPQLDKFFASITRLMTTLAGFKPGELAKIGVGFAGIAGFVAGLGLAFQKVTSDLEKIVPQLDKFFASITSLMTTIAGFSVGQLFKIAAGFLLIALFIYGLGQALATLTDRAISAIGPLQEFFVAMTQMMTAIAGFSVGQLFAIAAGFLLIALFVYGLGLALNTFTEQAIQAMPGLVELLGALRQLAALLAGMTVGEMVTMGVGLALIALFVWALAAALVYAAGPLASLATIFSSFATILEKVSSIASGLWDILSGIGGAIGDFFGGIGDFLGIGGGTLTASLAPQLEAAVAAAAPPPPPPPPPPPAGVGALGGAGALAAAPAAGPLSVDQTVNAGGITVNVNADKLEADAGKLLSDTIVAQLQQKLGALRSDQDFRAGARPAAA